MNLQSLATTLNWLSGQGPGNFGGKGRGGKGGKSNNRQTGNAWGQVNSVQDSSHLTGLTNTGIMDEAGNQATMFNNQGVAASVKWICSHANCHYPHYGNRPTCSNCKAPRNPAQEPTTLVCSKIKPRNAQPQLVLTAAPKAKPGPASTDAASSQAAAAASSGPAPSDAFAEDDCSMDPEPPILYAPACLGPWAVKLLIKEDVEAGLKYKEHFKVKISGQTELQEQLAVAQRKLAFLETAPPGDFSMEMEVCLADIKSLEEKLGNSPEEPLSEIPALGEENGRIGKVAQLLSKHQANMAAEEISHKETMADLESQVVNIRALMAREVSTAQAKTAANEELLAGLQAKVRSLTTSDHRAAAVNRLQDQSEFEEAVSTHFQPQWLSDNGLSGMTEEAVKAMCTRFMIMMGSCRKPRDSGMASAVDMDCSTNLLGKRVAEDRNWANHSVGSEEEL